MKNIIYILFAGFALISCEKPSQLSKIDLTDLTKEVHQLMEEEYDLHPVERGSQKLSHENGVALDFYHYGKAEALEARLLLHHAATKVLSLISPLSADQIEITIAFLDPHTHKPYTRESLSHATLLGGSFYYSVYEPHEGRFEQILKEEYTFYKN